jgi:alkyl hydroperoxide reductase subunit AhpF
MHAQATHELRVGKQPSLATKLAVARRFYATESPYDVVVVGSGPAGYIAAVKASQLGYKVRPTSRGVTGG